jgi:hypothetical protein
MWLIFFVVPLAIIMLIGGLLAGGIFTIVFLPLALIIAAVTVGFTMYGRSQRRPTLPSERGTTAPGPGGGLSNTPPRPSTPDDLVDARRQAQ